MKKSYIFNSQFAIQNYEKKYLVKEEATQSVALKNEKGFANKQAFLKSIIVFDTPFDAEEFIWKHGYLEMDATLRAVPLN